MRGALLQHFPRGLVQQSTFEATLGKKLTPHLGTELTRPRAT